MPRHSGLRIRSLEALEGERHGSSHAECLEAQLFLYKFWTSGHRLRRQVFVQLHEALTEAEQNPRADADWNRGQAGYGGGRWRPSEHPSIRRRPRRCGIQILNV